MNKRQDNISDHTISIDLVSTRLRVITRDIDPLLSTPPSVTEHTPSVLPTGLIARSFSVHPVHTQGRHGLSRIRRVKVPRTRTAHLQVPRGLETVVNTA